MSWGWGPPPQPTEGTSQQGALGLRARARTATLSQPGLAAPALLGPAPRLCCSASPPLAQSPPGQSSPVQHTPHRKPLEGLGLPPAQLPAAGSPGGSAVGPEPGGPPRSPPGPGGGVGCRARGSAWLAWAPDSRRHLLPGTAQAAHPAGGQCQDKQPPPSEGRPPPGSWKGRAALPSWAGHLQGPCPPSGWCPDLLRRSGAGTARGRETPS